LSVPGAILIRTTRAGNPATQKRDPHRGAGGSLFACPGYSIQAGS